jgi:hypothetical protein
MLAGSLSNVAMRAYTVPPPGWVTAMVPPSRSRQTAALAERRSYDSAMAPREAACSCGQLHLRVEGDAVRISVCHCLACQRRTGTAFGVQARFPAEGVEVSGSHREYVRLADEDGEERTFHFCPECGGTVFYTTGGAPELIAVPVGCFADPSFPQPWVSVWESRRHPWVGLPEELERDPLDEGPPLPGQSRAGGETREARCSCGLLHVEVEGEPFAVGICHCLACQRRTGSAFGMQAGYPAGRVRVTGRHADYPRTSDEADRKVHVFHFCPECGGTVFCTEPDDADLVVVMTGAFADPSFPPPTESGYGSRRHPWVGLPEDMQTDDAWESLRPLYEAGEFAQVADRGRELIEANPDDVRLAYNVACCESLAGRKADAIEHLRGAITRHVEFRSLAAQDSDLDPLREEPAFRDLVG